MSDFKFLIGGKLVAGAQTMDVINPATGRALTQSPRASHAQLDEAVAAAKTAFTSWARTPLAERAKVLLAIADTIEANITELARLLTQEQGKPLADATSELGGAQRMFRYFATLDLPVHADNSQGKKIELHRKPLGVVAAIVPWNFPVAMVASKLAPALLAGNTVVLKPAATTPLTTLRLGELLKDVLPAGVLNVVADANDLGGVLTSHADIRKISFTGSTATGIKVMAGAASNLKRITLELGGNDAAIVLDDVDPKEVAQKIYNSAFRNSGQICIAVKRLYVQEGVYDAVCEELAKLAKATVVGDGLDAATKMGPLQNRAQYEKVKQIIEDSRQHGKVIAGGDTPAGDGYFISPTIVRDITDGTRLVDEEQFGPVLPIIKFSDPQDAVNRANASSYGLGGSIWSSNPERAYALAVQIESGSVWINKHADLSPGIPFGGAKQSGFGTEYGQEGLNEFTQLQVVNIAV
ncbi:MAG: aldehyde dehydrogenase family protein [Janthinobacterium lividum]